MIRLVATSIAILMMSQAASADALTAKDIKRCNAMAATLVPKKAEIEDLKVKRDELAALVETKGEVWEEAEIHRLASAGHAAEADLTKTDYQAARGNLAQTEQALQALLQQFNQDVAAYNRSCATQD